MLENTESRYHPKHAGAEVATGQPTIPIISTMEKTCLFLISKSLCVYVCVRARSLARGLTLAELSVSVLKSFIKFIKLLQNLMKLLPLSWFDRGSKPGRAACQRTKKLY